MFKRFQGYRWPQFGADALAGGIAAVIMIPQAMAYAILAGLPPEYGLYACLAPLVLYGMFGGSTSLSVGPVALIALLVYSGVSPLAPPGSPQFIALCGTLALMSGTIKVVMALFRMGFMTNFISFPVLVGFTNAAAIIIVLSQLKHWIGISIEHGEYPIEWIWATLINFSHANRFALGMGMTSCAILWLVAVWQKTNKDHRDRFVVGLWLAKLAPMLVVAVAALWVLLARLDQSVEIRVIGDIPRGLPGWSWPSMDLASLKALLPVAVAVALVGYVQSMSVAQALAIRKRERVDPNRELFALGMADVGAAVTQGFPVTGSFSVSTIRDAAGSQTPVSSIMTAAAVALAVIWLTPWFYFIPQAVLASIVMVSVVTIIDWRTPLRLWRYSRNDAFTLWFTFLAVIVIGVEWGIVVGIAATFVSWLWRTSRPQIIEVGRIPGRQTFRNVQRYRVEQVPGVFAIRMDESLYFANARYLHEFVLRQLAERPDLRAVLLIASGVNRIDATGIEVLKLLIDDLNRAGVLFVMSDVKWAVTNRLQRSDLSPEFLQNSVFLTPEEALQFVRQELGESSPDADAAPVTAKE